MSGWLVGQLPEAMQRQELLVAFARTGEEVADSIRFQLAGLDHQLDPDTATGPMLTYLASWFGFSLDASADPELVRGLLKRVGQIIRSRGTRGSLATLLEVLSGGQVEVLDPGGVVGPEEALPAASTVVVVRLSRPGPLGAERLAAIAQREAPIGVLLQLEVTGSAA